MLPARGFRLGLRSLYNGKGRPQLPLAQSRLFSGLLQQNHSAKLPLQSAQQRVKLPSSVLPQSKRYASNTPSSLSPDKLNTAPPLSDTTSGNEWDALLQEASDAHMSNIEPHIGWLKEIGLDYGWGPTAFMESILEQVNLYSGLPWWASILIVAYGTRMALLGLHVKASDQAARLSILTPSLKPVQEKMRVAQASKDQTRIAAATVELKGMTKAAGLRPVQMFIPVVLQGILGFGMFRLTGGMSRLPVPGFEEGGMLWFQDLTVMDPFYILPVLSGVTMWYAVKRGGESGTAQLNPTMMKIMLYALPTMTTAIFFTLPAGLQFLAFIAASWSFFQGALLRSERFRDAVGITPFPKRDAFAKDTPYKGTVSLYRTPEEKAKENTMGERWRSARGTVKDYVNEQTKAKKTSRLSAGDLQKAQQYEKERRAEIEAARERFLNDRRRP